MNLFTQSLETFQQRHIVTVFEVKTVKIYPLLLDEPNEPDFIQIQDGFRQALSLQAF